MASSQIPIIEKIDDREVMRIRSQIKTLSKEEQMKLMIDAFNQFKVKFNDVPIEALVEKNPHLKEMLEKKIIPSPNELSDAFERLLNEKPSHPLFVNDVEYETKKGVETAYGYYKNGWKIHDVKGDGKYKQLNIYTSRNAIVDYEHRMMFKKTKMGSWKLVVLEGFDGIDLLKVVNLGNCETHVLDYLNALLK